MGKINFRDYITTSELSPLDSRQRVPTVSNLWDSTYWTTNGTRYQGMIVSVYDTGDIYVLSDINQKDSEDGWNKIGSGGISQEDLDNLRDSLSGGIQSNRDILGELSGSYISLYNDHQQRKNEVDDLFNSLSGDIKNIQNLYNGLSDDFDALSGRVKNIRTEIDDDLQDIRSGLTVTDERITARLDNLSGNIVSYVDFKAGEIQSVVSALSGGDFSEIRQTLDSITQTVNSLSGITELATTVNGIKGTVADFSAATIGRFELTSTNFNSAISNLSSSVISHIDQTANRIRLSVGDLSSNVYSKIEQTARDITQRVSDLSSGTVAQLVVRADGIESNVSNLSGSTSNIEQTANNIRLSVDNFSAATCARFDVTDNKISSKVADFSSSVISHIEQTAESIRNTVGNLSSNTYATLDILSASVGMIAASGMTKAQIIAKINEKGNSEVLIDASQVMIHGKVLMNELYLNQLLTENAVVTDRLRVGDSNAAVDIMNGGITARTGQIGNLKLMVLSGNAKWNKTERQEKVITEQVYTISTGNTILSGISISSKLKEKEGDYNKPTFSGVTKTVQEYLDEFSGSINSICCVYYDGGYTGDMRGLAMWGMMYGEKVQVYISRPNIDDGEILRVYDSNESIDLASLLNTFFDTEVNSGRTEIDFIFKNTNNVAEFFNLSVSGMPFKEYTTETRTQTIWEPSYSGNSTDVYPIYHENFKINDNGHLTAKGVSISNSSDGFSLEISGSSFYVGNMLDYTNENAKLISLGTHKLLSNTNVEKNVIIRGGLDVDTLSLNQVELGSDGTVVKVVVLTESQFEEIFNSEDGPDGNTLYITY